MAKNWKKASSIEEVRLGEKPLSIEDVVAVARHGARVELSPPYVERVKRGRAHVERFAEEERALYGITTGLGENWNRYIAREERDRIQRNHVLSHACSVGEPLEEECVRAMMVVMLQHFGTGHTGMGLAPLRLLAAMLNGSVTPFVPAHGSVGYICHEGHIGCALIGEGFVLDGKGRRKAAEALAEKGLEPVTLASKEGLTLVSGTTTVTALAALGLYDALVGARTADIAGALSLEVLKGTLMAFDERVHGLRPHPYQATTASNVRKLLEGSEIVARYRGHRVQDALSLRCIPQLHGAAKQLLDDMARTLDIELNASVDNPLIVEVDGGAEALMACNADGSYVGMAADGAAIALAGLAKMAERRIDRLVNRHVSELPPFLCVDPGVNNGLMIPQYAAAGLVGEMRLLAHPATVDNGFTCANQEDYTSMGAGAAVKLYRSARLLRYILAIELLDACQAQDFYGDLRAAPATAAVRDRIRRDVPFVGQDVMMEPLIEAIAVMVGGGEILEAAWSVTGELPL
ncbi:aromatic amino acid lyase [Aminithiophilus ramosus]|uniref:Aromatic amino acid lyase n=2 Tax=Synergistales TaxID=649776 RepID=A0A9Q7AND5_9BACT|nr:aromatic amino acid lyase [Aminithiophilus ramosus]QTX32042.1 aromatic amino acid lyase [Aminithiophilus ramosus]QVL35882.1 aromatic amino acid lyase [Synergistota bacterium]